ncbi:MAG TPA: N-acetylmuramic acid 6-phosphate etherase [Candidatus Acidoferrum sp.]|nr:N-acetylmuramic acid 6-phosphate etherase [Candidatus Acidoferrum sp.]
MASSRKTVNATEQRNPRTRGIDLLSTRNILKKLNREDATVAQVVALELPTIARAVDAMVRAIHAGGRVIYIGAGTSGRLAALDVAEVPPTFGVSPRIFQAAIAGGRRALTGAVEGAEDSVSRGAKDIAAAHVTKRDIVIGLTASGSTPYVLAALKKARKIGAATIGITSNRRAPIARVARILIAPDTGAEAIAGSTRLKGGTAQKLVLNMLSTATMVRLGRVYDNWMIGVALTNKKLQRRGVRILEQASGANVSEAERVLRQAGHDLCVALIILKCKTGAAEARLRLKNAHGDLRTALGERKTRGGRIR